MIDFGIIAAGEGERIRNEGSSIPKPLVEIEGKPMIGRLISLMENCDARSVSVIVNSGMPEVIDYLQSLIPVYGCELKIVSKTTPSSMHSFYELLNVMKPEDKFIVTTVDTVFRSDDFKRYANYFNNAPDDIDGVMGVTDYIDDEKPLYIETDSRDSIVAFNDAPEDRYKYISAGIYGLRSEVLPVLGECIGSGVGRMRNFQRKLLEKGFNLKAFNLGKVFDVDHLSDIEKANAYLV